jgi:hypothetical protein
MESLPQSSPLREFYPEDSYPGGELDHLPLTVIVFTVIYTGGYYPSPFGRVKYWVVGPEGGQKESSKSPDYSFNLF